MDSGGINSRYSTLDSSLSRRTSVRGQLLLVLSPLVEKCLFDFDKGIWSTYFIRFLALVLNAQFFLKKMSLKGGGELEKKKKKDIYSNDFLILILFLILFCF